MLGIGRFGAILGAWMGATLLGLEGAPGSSAGLGLLGFSTELAAEKQLRNVRGHLLLENAEVNGYEIHAGVTTGVALEQPAVRLDDGRCDGAQSADGHILGTYLHGLFESPEACGALLRWARNVAVASGPSAASTSLEVASARSASMPGN